MNRLACLAASAVIATGVFFAPPTFAIVGGQRINANEFPWQVGLWFDEWSFLLGF